MEKKESKISLIVAMTENGIIGNNGVIPWYLPDDIKHFKNTTMGLPIIMGRKTHESIGKILPGRTNIVVTSKKGYYANGSAVVYSINAALELASVTDPGKEIMIIGGEQIYRQTIVFAEKIYATYIHGNFDGDTFFPHISGKDWIISDYDFKNSDNVNHTPHSFVIYERRK